MGTVFKRPFITSFCMGFSSGAPYLVIFTLIQAWLTNNGIDVKTIGLMGAAGLPYALKFLWAPWLDYYDPPFLGRLGRRRGWLLISQIDLMLGLFILSFIRPTSLTWVAVVAFCICFASATQDIIVDAYRRDDLKDEELGLGSACYQWGYRLGMQVVSGGGLILALYQSWPLVFRLAALLMLAGPLTLLFSPEPKVERPVAPASFVQTVLVPLVDFFKHAAPWSGGGAYKQTGAMPLFDYFKRPAPWLILGFIFFYKFGDQLAGSLTTNYYIKLGYDTKTIGLAVKIVGAWASLAGVVIGGWAIYKFGQRLSLWLFGFLQMFSTLGFALLYYLPLHWAALAAIVSQENLAAGAGSSVFVAFMAGQTNRSFSATQYALLSALMALPRTVLSAPAGYLVEGLGWPGFYVFSTVMALPGFFILHHLSQKRVFAFEEAVR